MIPNPEQAKTIIAKRIAAELKDGWLVNLGIGLPTLVANYIPDGVHVTFQAENGMTGMGPAPEPGKENLQIQNAGGQNVSILPGGSFFDSLTSFSLIRGGHVDATILGTLEVDQEGNLANWIIPGKKVPGMGGAMDLVSGANLVIVATLHTEKGRPKILKKCKLPLTAHHEVNMIVTELAVIDVRPGGLVLREHHPDVTVEEIKSMTEADLFVSEHLKPMAI
ncbi:MAG TPA: 3-oxoacid CoA-transferase subunit B [Candidatus Ozemobacteraceae bacterium]|nr:3-oxoacid CoA-transferase subunit B [Candidatus Ozemobacteraceae bacterium]